ncbi:MAG: translation initiation factor IF-2 subunit beta [Nanoarchaeota archaeon]|nr:translation initiation factor IF-2 subunit beta [Nanoarchaeota archaeon]MEC8339798.1 translation initiation factor IF-2 subunit beta [Nanoarchaeota archaeon]
MDDKVYEQLLDQAYSELPEVLYKKERFVVPEVSGRLVKTRTQIRNFGEIAKHLARDQEHMHKFMLKFVGVRGDLNANRGEVILHSRFQPAILNKGIQKYYTEYVECPHCTSPDTELVEEGGIKKCKACGHQEKVTRL